MTYREYFAERKSIRDQLEDLYSDKKRYTTSELLYLLDYEIEQIVEDVLRDHDSITETQRSDATYWVEREESGEESR